MDFTKYRRLRKATLQARTFEDFIRRVTESSFWFGVPLWNKENYRWFYERVKGGYKYADLVKAAA